LLRRACCCCCCCCFCGLSAAVVARLLLHLMRGVSNKEELSARSLAAHGRGSS
jgi:hypothetical protein